MFSNIHPLILVPLFLSVLIQIALLIIGMFITTGKIKSTKILGIMYLVDAILGFITNVVSFIRYSFVTPELLALLTKANSVLSVVITLAGFLFICLYVHKNYGCKWIYFPIFAQPVVNVIATIAFRAVFNRMGNTAQYIIISGLSTSLSSLVTGSVGAIILIHVFHKNRNNEQIIPHMWAIRLATFCASLISPIVSIIYYGVCYGSEVRGTSIYFFTSYKLTFFQFVFAAIYSLVCMIMPIYILVMVKRAEKKLEETSPYIED